MKRNVTLILLVIFVLSTFVFGMLWNKERNDKTEIILLAQASANDAHTNFLEYQKTGDDSYYWHGVSAFRSFQQAYYLLVENTNKAPNYTFCNQVYGSLVLFPERSQSHIAEIVGVMELLAQNVEKENGYLLMANLRNTI